jgi:hypothetical protein
VNEHDLDAAAGFFHEDYRSEQPAHPGRAFVGRAHMRANWEAMFAGIPDFHAEICRSVWDGETAWTEWRWSGTRQGPAKSFMNPRASIADQFSAQAWRSPDSSRLSWW